MSDLVTLGLEDSEREALLDLLRTLQRKRVRNVLRRGYYDGHQGLRDLGIAIPPALRKVEVVVGWPAKAVDAMSRRTTLDGFTTEFAGEEISGLVARLWDENRLDVQAPSAHTSALIHSCGFLFVTGGGAADGRDVLIQAHSAEEAAARWNQRTQRIDAALSVTEWQGGTPSRVNLYLPGVIVSLADVEGRGRRLVVQDRVVHQFGIPVEAIPYRPSLSRPFGRSRITRPAMYLTDATVRTLLRTEVGAEFYNAPQRYALGVDDDAFTDDAGNAVPAWTVMLGRLLTLTRDEDGEMPQVGQFSQQTMQPNLDQLRALAQQFAAETSLPVSSLGIVQDNPSSAEAMQVANEELGIEIEHWQRSVLGPAWRRMMATAVLMSTGTSSAARAEAATLQPHWGKWWVPNEAAAAQAALARVQAVPALAGTDVELERMGYSAVEIARIREQTTRAAAVDRLDALVGVSGLGS